MKCLSESDLQSLADGQTPRKPVDATHLETCHVCRDRWKRVRERRLRLLRALARLDPAVVPAAPDSPLAKEPASRRHPRRLQLVVSLTFGLLLAAVILLELTVGPFFKHTPAPFTSVVKIRGNGDRLQVMSSVDLSRYRPISKPRIFVFKEENNELKAK